MRLYKLTAAVLLIAAAFASASCAGSRGMTRTVVLPPAPVTVEPPSDVPAFAAPEITAPQLPEPRNIAYITIDDGPSRNVTPEMLDILQAHGVKATFFVLPRADADDLYERIISDGHALGNHTYSHEYGTLYGAESADPFRADVVRMHDYISARCGYEMSVFRFPGGTAGQPEEIIAPRAEILGKLGYRWFDWDAAFGDATLGQYAADPEVLAGNALRDAEGGRVIISLHDSEGMSASAAALEIVIAALKERGYVFDTLENW